MGNIVSLANNQQESCEPFGGLSFWQARKEAPGVYFNPEFEYFSFETVGGDSIMMLEDKTRSALKIGSPGKNPGFQKAIFSPMVPQSISGRNRGLRPGDHLVFFGSMNKPRQYKLEGGVMAGLGDDPRGVFYTTKRTIEPQTMTLRVAPNPELGQGDLPVYEESDETDTSDEYPGIPVLNPTTEVWEWAGPNSKFSKPPRQRYEGIPEVSQEASDIYIEQADWSTGNKMHDFRLMPPGIAPKDPYRLPAGSRYGAQRSFSDNNPQTEESTLHTSDLQVNPYQTNEDISRILGGSDITERLFMNSQEEATLDTSDIQLNLGSTPFTPPGYGDDVFTGFPAGSEEGTGILNQIQDFDPNPKQASKSGNLRQPSGLGAAARRKLGQGAINATPFLPESVLSGNNNI
ncbi:hypothetical protein TWF481_010904 [Arthrobotrys musiformis]|uniref:Uncharacterized protein n=1 Tax=Arthrobotrys musiformis TaxID=47236 RepID=A0AAV9VYP8_9PEZI